MLLTHRRSVATDHAVEQVECTQSDGLIFVIKTLQDEIFVSLNTLGMSLEDLGHCHQAQVLHYTDTQTLTDKQRQRQARE